MAKKDSDVGYLDIASLVCAAIWHGVHMAVKQFQGNIH
jgi:hypothetical protein